MLLMTGKFKLIDSVNYWEYMKSIGVDYLVRMLNHYVAPVNIITKEGDEWTIKTIYPFETLNTKFKLGKEFDIPAVGGRPCKCVFTQEGNDKLVFVKRYADDGQTRVTIVRQFCDNIMKITLRGPGDVVATRIYEKIFFPSDGRILRYLLTRESTNSRVDTEPHIQKNENELGINGMDRPENK